MQPNTRTRGIFDGTSSIDCHVAAIPLQVTQVLSIWRKAIRTRTAGKSCSEDKGRNCRRLSFDCKRRTKVLFRRQVDK